MLAFVSSFVAILLAIVAGASTASFTPETSNFISAGEGADAVEPGVLAGMFTVAEATCKTNSDCPGTGIIRPIIPGPIDPKWGLMCANYYPDDDENKQLVFYTLPTENARCFVLEEEGCTSNRVIDSVTFGVKRVSLNPVKVAVEVYRDCGCALGIPGQRQEQLISSVIVSVDRRYEGRFLTIPVENDVALAPHESIRVQISQRESGQGAPYSEANPYYFWPAAAAPTFSGQTYYRALACRLPKFVTSSSNGFVAGHQLIISIQTSPTDEEATPLQCCFEEDCNAIEDCDENFYSCALAPVCKDPPRDSCNFYRLCVELGLECGPDGYPLQYGEKMCRLYLDNKSSLSRAGKQWTSDIQLCLQKALVPALEKLDCNSCSDVEAMALASIVPCYESTDFCKRLTLSDIGWLMYWTQTALDDKFPIIQAQLLSAVRSCDVFAKFEYAAVNVVLKESLAYLENQVFGSKSSFVEFLRDKVLGPSLPSLTSSWIWSVVEGSTDIVVLITEDGVNDPQSVATNLIAGLESSLSGPIDGVTLTLTKATMCQTNDECMKMLGLPKPAAQTCNRGVALYKTSGGQCRFRCIGRLRAIVLKRFGWSTRSCQ